MMKTGPKRKAVHYFNFEQGKVCSVFRAAYHNPEEK